MSITDPRLSWEDTFLGGKYQRTLELLHKVPTEQRTEAWRHNVEITEYCAQSYSEEELLTRLRDLTESENEPVLNFNKALLLYKMKQFRSSRVILDKLWLDRESLDTRISGPAGLLLIDLAILAQNYEKATEYCDELHAILIQETVDEYVGEEPDLLTKLALYKVKLFSLSGIRQNKEKSEDHKRDLKIIRSNYFTHLEEFETPSESWELLNVNALTMRAKIESFCGDFTSAISSVPPCPDPQLSSVLLAHYNNLACINKASGNPGLAKFYLTRTLTYFEEVGLSNINEYRVKTLFNLGLCFLHDDGDYETSMLCFEETRPLYYNRPDLWLRMSECCIQHHHKKLQSRLEECCQSSLIRHECTGSICGRRLLLPLPQNTLDLHENDENHLSLSSGLVYLKNAHILLLDGKNKKLYYHVLICLAYVCLCKGSPNQAEQYCSELLSHDGQPSSHYKIIAKNYMAEALCMQGRSSEAVQHLDISNENVSDNNNNICASFSNLAAVYLLEKNEEKASLCLQAALTSNPTYFPAIRLLIFLYLQNGMTDEALFLLSKQRPMPTATN